MGDEPKPRDRFRKGTVQDAEKTRAAIGASRRRIAAEHPRGRSPFRPAPPEIMIQLCDLAADRLLALALAELQQSKGPVTGPLRQRSRVSAIILRGYIRRRLADAGVSLKEISRETLAGMRAKLEKALPEGAQALSTHIKDEFDPLAEELAASHGSSPEKSRRLSKELVEEATYWKLYYYRMSNEMVDYVEDRLRSSGMDDPDAARIAEKIVAYLENPARYPARPADHAQVDLLVDLVVSASTADFNRAAQLTLPPRAPAIWSNKADRLEGETAVQFLRRVWGRYMDAGILYQDDIKRLGDSRLVATIRTYCHSRGEDAAAALPPPRKVRLERALAQVEPGSPAAILLKERMQHRLATARRRREQRLAPVS